MHIYIDESGIFSNPANKANYASVVVALTVPSTHKATLFKRFRELAATLPTDDGEVKGRLLDEDQIAAVLRLLAKFDCIVEINVIDLGIHTDDQLVEYQKGICEIIAGWATEERPEEFKKQVAEIAAALQKPKSPLFVESFLLMVLIPRILDMSMNYYARRLPKELGSYHWVIDAKEKFVTDFERAWYTTIFPSVEHQSKQTPFQPIENGDYSHLAPYYELPPDMAERAAQELKDDLTKIAFNVQQVLSDFKFQDSKENIGLQLTDVVANATQRALNRNLRAEGYESVGELLVLQTDPGIRLCVLDPKAKKYEPIKVEHPFHAPINVMLKKAKPLWGSPKQEEHLRRRARKRNKKKFGYDKALSGIAKP
jgi:hypothetical protein